MEHYFTNNPDTKSELRIIKYTKDNMSFAFTSDNGVFAKDRIDYGSSFLLDTLLDNIDYKINNVLDVGCGYGFLGIVISKKIDVEVSMVDVNKRAIHLCEINIKNNKANARAWESNCYDTVTDSYDLIVSNPPIRAGKEIVKKILFSAREHLNKDGEVWFVMRKDHGAKSMIKALEETYKVEVIAKSKGFYVIRMKIR